jgi:hypothetical protein
VRGYRRDTWPRSADNRSASFDSRRAGYVEGGTLLGVVRRVL